MNPFAKALAIAVPAGAAAQAAHLPLPWTVGPLIACAIANLAGAGVSLPLPAHRFGQWMIGTVLGLYFTPGVVRELVGNAGWIAAGVAWAALLGAGFAWALRRFARVSRPTAFFGGAIGGATEMTLQGELSGGRGDQIAAAHSLRIVLVVLTIPWVYRWLDLHGADPYPAAAAAVDAVGLAMLVAATVAGALAWGALGAPNPWVLGPLAIALGLTATGHAWSALPGWLTGAGQIAIGASLGARFTPAFFAQAPRFLGVVAAATAVGMVLSAGFGLAVAAASGLSPATAVLATAPGGIAEMALTAKTLQLGVPVVAAFHATRMAAMTLAMGAVYRALARWRRWETPR